MNFENAARAISELVNEREGSLRDLHLLFTGGEPFLEFLLIKDLFRWAQKAFPRLSLHFKAVTNGTLVHGDIQDWLLDNRRHFSVELSLDGIPGIHNRQRSNSLENIDLHFFRDRLGIRTVSTVLVPDSLSSLADNITALEAEGFYVKCTPADGVDWATGDTPEKMAIQLRKLAEHYLANPDQQPFSMLTPSTWLLAENAEPEKCRPGKNSAALGTDGKLYACHRCSEYYNTGDWPVPFEDLGLKDIDFPDNACHSCVMKNICGLCPATVASIRHDRRQSEARCRLSKVMALAGAWLQLQMLATCPDHAFLQNRSSGQLRSMVSGARQIIDHINPATAF